MNMNNKERYIQAVVSAVVDCCATEIDDEGTMSVTREAVLGRSRAENVVMTRCIAVMMLLGAGYSVTTIAQIFRRTPNAIRHLVEAGNNYLLTSRAFRIANAEATLRCRDIEDGSSQTNSK